MRIRLEGENGYFGDYEVARLPRLGETIDVLPASGYERELYGPVPFRVVQVAAWEKKVPEVTIAREDLVTNLVARRIEG